MMANMADIIQAGDMAALCRHAPPEAVAARLAEEFHVPISEVVLVYASEAARLHANACVTAFIPILAVRKARDTLFRNRFAGEEPARSSPT